MPSPPPLPPPPLTAWSLPAGATSETIAGGLINETFLVRAAGRPLGALQRLNTRIFAPVVHEDIEAVTAHLAARGLATPRLLRTRDDALWATDSEGGIWRLLSWVGDRTVNGPLRLDEARSAGLLVARFHTAAADLRHEFRSIRGGFHDTERHLATLTAALARHPAHHHRDAVRSLADALFAAWAGWRPPHPLPARVVHGDLKVSNVRFAGSTARALIDLDTLGRGTLDAELGDALRSWCNPAGEDSSPRFDLDLFSAALTGYAAGALEAERAGGRGPTEEEWESLVPGLERIALELAARFAADALDESYFGWCPERFASRGDHNLARARGQLALAAAVRQSRGAALHLLAKARSTASRSANHRHAVTR